MSKATPFLEANALLALQAGDKREAWKILNQMLPGELRELSRAAESLASHANIIAANKLANDWARYCCRRCGKLTREGHDARFWGRGVRDRAPIPE